MVKLSEMKNIEEYHEYYKSEVQLFPSNLQDMIEHLQTEEICKLAVQRCGYSLEYVKEEYKTTV